jgi:exodeoxyribonuclease VII large subunit
MLDYPLSTTTGKASGDLTVSELNGILKQLIEESLPVVTVIGELSNYVRHSSGHRYFTLKDEQSQLRCVLFKWQSGRLDFEPEEGMMLRAVGNVTVYERGGQYQLNVLRLQPLGRGELLLRLEELKHRLDAEGIFANSRPLPPFPHTVGVITSPSGAAVRDIISVIARRAPHIRIILRPTLVQGEGAVGDIVRAISEMNRIGGIDVLIVGRGGGSIEDLWCFNDEQVARAIFASTIPVVSAVGHETDVTLADFAADLRAPTPSAAAELVVPDTSVLLKKIESYRSTMQRELTGMTERFGQRLDKVRYTLNPARFQRDIMVRGQRVDENALLLRHAFDRLLTNGERIADHLAGKLSALNPRGVLNRGYAIVSRDLDRKILTNAAEVTSGDRIMVDLAHGTIHATVEGTNG